METDADLLVECRNGSEGAWVRLIKKHGGLVFSIPIRAGFSPDEAADIFQNVWLDLLQDLHRLRELNSLPAWLIKVCSHKCYHLRVKRGRMPVLSALAALDTDSTEPNSYSFDPKDPVDFERVLYEAESLETLRECIALMPGRCQEMIQMLFFNEPASAYKNVAARLGIAAHSVSAIRQRCLERLRESLEEKGF